MQPQTPSSDIVGVSLIFIYTAMVLWFFQAVHLTHEWMEEKLQTYFRMDTGCLNHNTSMKNCKCFFNSFSLTLQGKVHFAFSKRSFEQYQVSDHDEMLEE